MELWQEILLVGVGLIAGYLNVMAGGGSLITVPVMLFMGVSGPVANGTNRIGILFQNITAITTFFRSGFSDFKLSITLSLCALPGALIGAYFGTMLDGVWFNRLIAIIMVGVLIIMAVDNNTEPTEKPTEETRPQRIILTHVLMVFVGFYGGIVQMGVGFIIMPILYRVMGLDLVRVNMHKVFIIMSYTIVALAVFATQSGVLWVAGFFLTIGNMLGGWIATRMMLTRGEKLIKIILYSVLSVFIVKLLFFAK